MFRINWAVSPPCRGYSGRPWGRHYAGPAKPRTGNVAAPPLPPMNIRRSQKERQNVVFTEFRQMRWIITHDDGMCRLCFLSPTIASDSPRNPVHLPHFMKVWWHSTKSPSCISFPWSLNVLCLSPTRWPPSRGIRRSSTKAGVVAFINMSDQIFHQSLVQCL